MLNQAEIDGYKSRLEKEKERLVKEIETESTPNNPGNEITSSNEEEADEAEDFANQLAVAQTLRDEVQEIDRALEHIEAGNYGKCEKCGMEIEKEVLDAAPESVLCEKCKLEG